LKNKLLYRSIPAIIMLGMLSTGVPANAADATGSIPVGQSATQVLSTLTVGVKSDVSSDRKSHQWNKVDGKTGNYTTRDLVLERDMSNVTYNSRGNVNTGILLEPYTGKTIHFQRGQSNKTEGGSASNRDGGIQIDHVVAYAEAYRSGLDKLDFQQRDTYYNDPDVLLVSQAEANNVKKDGTIAEWKPSNQAFQCDYASLQIGIKAKYGLMVDQKEHDKLAQVLASCPTETIISTSQVKQRLTSGTSEGNNTGTANNNTTGGNSQNSQYNGSTNSKNNSHTTNKHHTTTTKKNWVKNLFNGLLKRFF
jgi:hypothetical protein